MVDGPAQPHGKPAGVERHPADAVLGDPGWPDGDPGRSRIVDNAGGPGSPPPVSTVEIAATRHTVVAPFGFPPTG